jgi:hypothetical protein
MRWFDPVEDFGMWNPVEALLTGDLPAPMGNLPPGAMALIRSTIRPGDTLLDVLRKLNALTPPASQD